MDKELNNGIVCYQGLPYSYSESAARTMFGDKTLIHKETFEDVFREVYEDRADIGVVPLENSTAGHVQEVYDLLMEYNLYINYSYIKKVDHCLAGIRDGELKDVKEIYSHPQALMQCREFIKENGYMAKNEINTAVAAKKVFEMNNKNAACICSVEAAENYGLKILKENINSEKLNYTKFGAISKKLETKQDHNRVSIVFTVPHEVGTLHEVMSIFAQNNVNLSYIYSRPDVGSLWKYLFYMDFEENIIKPEIQAILERMKKELPIMKILGSYRLVQ